MDCVNIQLVKKRLVAASEDLAAQLAGDGELTRLGRPCHGFQQDLRGAALTSVVAIEACKGKKKRMKKKKKQ